MVQKPVNPSPNNESIDGNDSLTLSCGIPKGNVEGYSVRLYSADSGNMLYQNTVEGLGMPINKISQSVPSDKYIQGEEYVWNCSYWRKRSVLEELNCFTQISLPSITDGQTVILNPEINNNQIIAVPPSSLAVATYKFEPQTYPALSSSGVYLCIEESGGTPIANEIASMQDSSNTTFAKIWYIENEQTFTFYTRLGGVAFHQSPHSTVTTGYNINPPPKLDSSFSSYHRDVTMYMEIFKVNKNDNTVQLGDNVNALIKYTQNDKYEYEEIKIASAAWWSYNKSTIVYMGCNGNTRLYPVGTNIGNNADHYMEGYLLLTLENNLSQSYVNNYNTTGLGGFGDGLSNNCVIKIYSETQDINFSPDYYFQTRTPATFTITNSDITAADNINTLSIPTTSFGITYSQPEGSEVNYFRMYLYEKKPGENEYRQIKESDLLINPTDTFGYSGFITGNEYKIEAIGTTTDGETITAEKFFTCSYTYTSDYASEIGLAFDGDTNAIEVQISPTGMLAGLPSCRIYRQDNTLGVLEFVGELYSSAIQTEYTMIDYGVGSNRNYNYIIQYTENDIVKFCKTSNITPDFCGTSIMSVRKNGDIYDVIENISLAISFSDEMSEIKLNIANEYTSGFGEWEFESKGYVGNIQSSVKGILPNGYNREKWESFLKNDEIKIYKLLDGGIYIIGIDSASIQPYYFPSEGIVNDASFSYRTLGNTRGMSICKALYSEEG